MQADKIFLHIFKLKGRRDFSEKMNGSIYTHFTFPNGERVIVVTHPDTTADVMYISQVTDPDVEIDRLTAYASGQPDSERQVVEQEPSELTAEDEKEVTQVHAIMNFWFAQNNIDKESLIHLAFDDISSNMRVNLLTKFRNCEFNLYSFIEAIDERFRGKLITFIMNNYQGLNRDAVEQKYLNLITES